MNYRDRRCPHCGRTNGLYTKNTYRNVRDFYDFEGNKTEENLDDAYKESVKYAARLYVKTKMSTTKCTEINRSLGE